MTIYEKAEWVSLRRAADILGVHPATVRNWADSGRLSFRRTAGKHRRFDVRVLRHFLQSNTESSPSELEMMVNRAIGRTRIDIGTGRLEGAEWCRLMPDNSRARLRELAGLVLDGFSDYILAGAPEAGLAVAFNLAKDYAIYMIDNGLSLQQALGGWVWFSDTVLNSVETYSEIRQPTTAAEWSTFVRQFNLFMSSGVLSLVEYYDAE